MRGISVGCFGSEGAGWAGVAVPHSLPSLAASWLSWSLLHIPRTAEVGDTIWWGHSLLFSRNHDVSCSVCSQTLSLVRSTSLLFFPSHVPVVTGRSPSVCITSVWSDGLHFCIVLSIPRPSPAPQQHTPKQGNFLSPVSSGAFCCSRCQLGKLKHLKRNNSCLAKSHAAPC